MKSSYKENRYNNVFKALAFCIKPKRIVEFGILEAYSLVSWIESTDNDTQIEAYDIFEDFPYNGASYPDITERFSDYQNVAIKRGDFFGTEKQFKNGEIDILHIDIANNGATYQYAIDHYMQKVAPTGVCILEGGSTARDNVYWMQEFDKPPIQDVICDKKNQQKYNILVLEDYPSITLITHKQGKP